VEPAFGEGESVGQKVYQHTLANGLVLLAERMEHVRSAAINFLIPAGCAYDPPGRLGVASLLAELITRGAGERNNRELSLALDGLGLDRGESVGRVHMQLWGSTLDRNVSPALDLYADIILRPHLPVEELEPIQALAIQDIQRLEDAPQQKVKIELRRRYYPPPFNKDRRGEAEDIESMTIGSIQSQYRRLFRPNGAILSVAGNLEWEPLKEKVEHLFGGWKKGEDPDISPTAHVPKSDHLQKDTQQTQIALAYPSVPIGNAQYYDALAAAGVLSGGMSSRLFTEVREKRGLCYAVHAFHETLKDRGAMLAYAGSRTDRAQQTLDVLVQELHRLKDGVTDDEIDRVKARLKSTRIMQEESTAARAGAIANDWYFLGRVQSFDEIQAAIDGLTPHSLIGYLDRHPVKDMVILTLGPEPLSLPS
jgi:predicted Zn-dependent peptidase